MDQILSLERAQTESTLILCWALIDNLVMRNKKLNETFDSSPIQLNGSKYCFIASSGAKCTLEELTMAKDCLKVLKTKSFFENLVAKKTNFTAFQMNNLQKKLGGDVMTSDMHSNRTRETR